LYENSRVGATDYSLRRAQVMATQGKQDIKTADDAGDALDAAPVAQARPVVSGEDWAAAKRHYVVLPSGVTVGIEIPDLPELIAGGKLPNELIDIAVQVAQGNAAAVTRDAIEGQPEFYRHIVKLTVKEPKVSDTLYEKLPFEDKEMIVEIATRQRDLDALYQHIGGLHTSKRWATFRGLDDSDEALAST
jgi:hypothetical protein